MDENNTQTPPAEEVKDERTLAQLQDELKAMDFEGADEIKTKSVALSVIKALQKKEAEIGNSNSAKKELTDPYASKDNKKKDEKHYFGKAAKMKEHLDAQPKVGFVIPLGIGEKPGAIETWQANGYRLNILKGVMVMLPKQVVESLAESYQMTSVAGQEFLADRDAEHKEKLG